MQVKIQTGLMSVIAAVSLCATAAGELPEGYTQLPFLKASGNCQVKTGLTPVCTDKAELTFELSTVSGNQNLWCSRNDSTNSFTAFMIADKVRLDRNTTQVTSTEGLVVGTKYTLTADYGTGEGGVIDASSDASVTTITDLGTDEYDPERELCLFASYTTSVDAGLNNYGSWKFYSFKLYDVNDTLKCDLVPALRTEDRAIGLYDLVRDTFLTNGFGGVFAKLVDGTFHYYTDSACTGEIPPELMPQGIAGCTVLFGSDTEYQALVPYTNELATAFSVVLQNNVSLTADADWRAFDFDMNGKTVSLQGWDLIVHKPQGTGRFTSGNLVNPTGFSTAYSSYRSGDWYTFAGKPDYGKKRVYQSFTVPNARNIYFRCKTRSWNQSGYAQYISGGVDGLYTLLNWFQTGTKTTTTSHILTTDIKVVSGLAAGSRHELQFTNHNGWTYAGYICLSPTSMLTFDIAEGEEYVNVGITLGGANDNDFTGMGLQVHKTGKGQLTMSMVNSRFGGNGISSMIVEEGLVKKEAGATCGAQYSRIVVENGAQFDLNGRTYHDYYYTLAGSGPDGTGALTSTAVMDAATAYGAANNINPAFLRDVTLSSNATVYAANNMGMIFYNYSANTMTMNGHTVTYDGVEAVDGEGNGTGVGAYRTFLGNMSYSGAGKIVVATNGWIQSHISSPTATDTDIEVFGRFWMNSGRLTPVKSLVFKAGSRFRELNADPGVIVVTGTYGPNALTESAEGYLKYPKVKLGDASHLNATLDLSQWTTTFDDSADGTLTFHEGTMTAPMTVALEVGDRTEGIKRYAYLWKTKPDLTKVKFIRSENTLKRKVRFTIDDYGLRFDTGFVIHIK